MTSIETTSTPVAPKTMPRVGVAAPAKKVAAAKPAKSATKSVAKTVEKSTAKPAAKVASKQPAAKKAPVKAASKPTKATTTAAKPAKVKKPKMVRDSFTMPKAEFAVLDVLKARAANLKTPTKKTELLRAGIKALAAMSDAAFLAAIGAVPSLKTGRPSKS